MTKVQKLARDLASAKLLLRRMEVESIQPEGSKVGTHVANACESIQLAVDDLTGKRDV